jgi:hypothetical protein
LLERSLEAARVALNRLEEAGVVQLTTVAKRERVWESIGVSHWSTTSNGS